MALSKRTLSFSLVVITLSAIITLFFCHTIVQDLAYHQFADKRTRFAIHNFWNVISNLCFLITGLFGLIRLHQGKLNIIPALRSGYFIFFIAIALIAFGSAYYHWRPDNLTLVWDRLPITFAFMSLMSVAIGECLSVSYGRNCLYPLLLIGLLSVCNWYWGELHGRGDLRFYVLVQFLPLIILLVFLLFAQSSFKNQAGYWYLFIAYIAAKSAEHFDTEIFNCTSGIISGHVIKHIASAVGLYMLIIFFERRVNRSVTN